MTASVAPCRVARQVAGASITQRSAVVNALKIELIAVLGPPDRMATPPKGNQRIHSL